MGLSTRDSSKKICSKALALTSLLMELSLKESGRGTPCKDKAPSPTQMAGSMKGTVSTTNSMALEYSLGQTGGGTKVAGGKANSMD